MTNNFFFAELQHNLERHHVYSAPEKGVMDRGKKSYASRMKLPSPHSCVLLFKFHQTKVNMILMLHVKFILRKKQDRLCQLNLTLDVLKNREILYDIFIEGETKN